MKLNGYFPLHFDLILWSADCNPKGTLLRVIYNLFELYDRNGGNKYNQKVRIKNSLEDDEKFSNGERKCRTGVGMHFTRNIAVRKHHPNLS